MPREVTISNMDKRTLITLLCLGGVLLSQAAAAPPNNGQNQGAQGQNQGTQGNKPTGPPPAQPTQPAQTSNSTATSNKLMDSVANQVQNPATEAEPVSVTECNKKCKEECDEAPSSCEFIDGAIPVNCGDKREKCYGRCPLTCKCLFDCGCKVASGCGDDCSKACKGGPEDEINTTETTQAPKRLEEDKTNGIPVVYDDGETTQKAPKK